MDTSDVDKGASELRDEQTGREGNAELSRALHLCRGRGLGRGDSMCKAGAQRRPGRLTLPSSLPAPTCPIENDQILCICFIYLITVLNESFSKKKN